MAAKTGWHRYGTKLRYCQPMYTRSRTKVRNTDGVIRLCRTFDDVVAVAFWVRNNILRRLLWIAKIKYSENRV